MRTASPPRPPARRPRTLLPLTLSQQAAFAAVLAFLDGPRGAFVLTGSAGTGKTTLLGTVVSALEQQRRRVALLAPTARAARALSRRAQRGARTAHSHLYIPEPLKDTLGVRLVRKGLFADDVDVIVVDEASLVAARHSPSRHFITPAALLDDLMDEAARTKAHILFVGDPCQLPPVGEDRSEALRPDLLHKRYGIPVAAHHLDEVLRQAEGSVVLRAATALRDRLQGIETTPVPLSFFSRRADAVADYAQAVAGGHYERATLLAYTNRTMADLNTQVRARLGFTGPLAPGDLVVTERDGWADGALVPRSEPYVVETVAPAPDFAGLRFAQVRLAPLEPLALPVEGLALLSMLTSEAGFLTEEQEKALLAAALARNEQYRQSRKASDDPHVGALRLRYGYALTVHKAQGGEWPRVYLDPFVPRVVDPRTALRWRYTALTRAAERCYLIGTPRL